MIQVHFSVSALVRRRLAGLDRGLLGDVRVAIIFSVRSCSLQLQQLHEVLELSLHFMLLIVEVLKQAFCFGDQLIFFLQLGLLSLHC